MESAVITFPMFGNRFSLDFKNYFTLAGREIYWYGVIIALGFLLAALYVLKRREAFGLTQDNVLDFVLMAVPSGLVGARIYYAVFNASDFFGPGKWLNIFKLREGGLAIYGGVIFAFAAVLIYSRVKKIPFGNLCDAGGLGLLIGQAVGRWGNFVNREVYGVETSLPWRMGLSNDYTTIYVHPAFLYESLWCFIGFLLLHAFSKYSKRYPGQIFIMYLGWYGLGRYMIEGLRSDVLYLFNTEILVSQLLAAITFCISGILLLRNKLKRTELTEVEE